MRKTIQVMLREFVATVTTKGFLFGILLTPILIVGAVTLMPLLMSKTGPRVSGHLAVIDQTGLVAPKVEHRFTPEEVAKRLERRMRRGMEQMSKVAPIPDAAKQQAEAAMKAASGPALKVKILPPEADVEAEKAPILQAAGREKDSAAGDQRLALVVIPSETVKAGPDGNFIPYPLFVAPKLDFQVQEDMIDQIDAAIVDARLDASGLDTAAIRRLTTVPRTEAKAVTAEGERKTSPVVGVIVPMAFMMLIWISVFSAGQYLLTSLIEEKSSRVMEVLLSAVSPMQLMVGKILGQMGVGLVILGAYCAMGIVSLVSFQMSHAVDALSILYMLIFFMIAFFLIAAMMAAIGSCVSDIREAQSLMTPVMIVLIIPMMLWVPIQRNPNSLFAQVCSFIPPINPFVMVLRLTGSEKVPTWQIPASILAGLAGAVIACWAAAKIFRLGVLMYGKPPSFMGLVKMVRYA